MHFFPPSGKPNERPPTEKRHPLPNASQTHAHALQPVTCHPWPDEIR
ncbi:hypothetical protein HMPREF3038_02650 [Akkermansia sp. KLE1797]|nr:hypothetical protein HMPREF3038_02650 [Akkermansia sp. KLE1797]KXU53042.1 hypothetical protein HMPREF3039_02802 [Akkermansia sp. KLE1798]KZA03682.1 hypothetical protein HMPREF1326_02659 [Akkermansia sp. KLE1605]